MHADEVDIDADLVAQLIATQFPQWRSLSIDPVLPRGTDNALYRLGPDMVVTVPRHAASVPSLEKELRWLPVLAHALPVAIPTVVAAGEPAAGFPYPWAVYRWLDGESATPDRLAAGRTASDLAGILRAFARIDTSGGPPPAGRGGPLVPRDAAVRRAIATLAGRIDVAAVTRIWDEAVAAPVWDRPAVWIHGDLDARNVLAREGRIRAIVDFGSMAVGDPACDVMVAWKMLGRRERETVRRTLDVDGPPGAVPVGGRSRRRSSHSPTTHRRTTRCSSTRHGAGLPRWCARTSVRSRAAAALATDIATRGRSLPDTYT